MEGGRLIYPTFPNNSKHQPTHPTPSNNVSRRSIEQIQCETKKYTDINWGTHKKKGGGCLARNWDCRHHAKICTKHWYPMNFSLNYCSHNCRSLQPGAGSLSSLVILPNGHAVVPSAVLFGVSTAFVVTIIRLAMAGIEVRVAAPAL